MQNDWPHKGWFHVTNSTHCAVTRSSVCQAYMHTVLKETGMGLMQNAKYVTTVHPVTFVSPGPPCSVLVHMP